ncbi:MAG TPA: phytanoyl-CoA dioxygenase family protein [Planctomycetota bacterium]|nr:phytanoyl-CoA dioxygenase family protein [Planctomycetota bacterium]
MTRQFCQALESLGVRSNTLTDEERYKLDHDGFLVLHGILDQGQVARMRSEMWRVMKVERTGEAAGPEQAESLQNKSDAFDICITHPRVLAAVAHVLREDFYHRGVFSRPNPPGKGRQIMHCDWEGPPVPRGEYHACNSIWPLIDFTIENGATRVVPGSHAWEKHPDGEMPDAFAPHPQQIQLELKAGDVGIFNSHLWHSAMPNHSSMMRDNVTSFWGRRDSRFVKMPPAPYTPQARARLHPAARFLIKDA